MAKVKNHNNEHTTKNKKGKLKHYPNNIKENVRENMEKEYNPIEALLDPDNNDPIIMFQGDKEILLDQVAVIPMDDCIYAMLYPLGEEDDFEQEREPLVFEIVDEGDKAVLNLVKDRDIIECVFIEYDRIADEMDD